MFLGVFCFLYSIVSMLIHLCTIIFLVGGLEHFILCHILWTSSSQLTFIFFKGVSIPPTRYKQMVPKITPYMVPYITPFVYHHFCWLSPMICWTVTLDRHVTIPGLTRRSHRGLISEKIAREGFRNVKTEESNEDTQRISWNLSNVWLVFVYIYIWVHGFRHITYNPARNCYLCGTISKISCGNAQKWCVVLVKLNNLLVLSREFSGMIHNH